MVRTIEGLTQTVLEHKARTQDVCKEERKKLFSPVICGTQAPLQQYSKRETWFTELPSQSPTHLNGLPTLTPLSLSLLELQTCSHPKLYFSLSRRELTAPSKHLEDALRTELSRHCEEVFLGKLLIFHCPPQQWVCDTDYTYPEQGQTSCLFFPW